MFESSPCSLLMATVSWIFKLAFYLSCSMILISFRNRGPVKRGSRLRFGWLSLDLSNWKRLDDQVWKFSVLSIFVTRMSCDFRICLAISWSSDLSSTIFTRCFAFKLRIQIRPRGCYLISSVWEVLDHQERRLFIMSLLIMIRLASFGFLWIPLSSIVNESVRVTCCALPPWSNISLVESKVVFFFISRE